MSATCNSQDVEARGHFRKLDDLMHLDMIVDDYAAAVTWAREQAETVSTIEERIAELEGDRDQALEDLKEKQKELDNTVEELRKLEKDDYKRERNGLLDDIRGILDINPTNLADKLRELVDAQ